MEEADRRTALGLGPGDPLKGEERNVNRGR